jgi:hypothetical protein
LHIPLDAKVGVLSDVPYTISFVIRKRMQLDNLNELGKDKRPDDFLIFDGTSEELEKWLDRVLSGKEQTQFILEFNEDEIE